MYSFSLYGVLLHEVVLFGRFLFCSKVLFFQFRQLAAYVGKHEETGIVGIARNKVDALVRKLDAVVLLVYHKIQVIGDFVHAPLVLLHVNGLYLEHVGLDAGFAQKFNQRLVFGQSLECAVQ